ncbi:MAG: TIGR02186 family protein [Pseudomonadota bacterium]
MLVRMLLALACQLLATSFAAAEVAPQERIEIGLSTESIPITANFSGEVLTIFGAIENIDPLVQRQGRYDVFVILEGPRTQLTTRRKGRVLGIWMNVEDRAFNSVPTSYLVASTRLPRDITNAETLGRLGLTAGAIRLSMSDGEAEPGADQFVNATKNLKKRSRLYATFPASVRFVSQTLFRAQLALPANVPLGGHRVKAFLFNSGQLVAQTNANLRIEKAGLEFEVFRLAQDRPLIYGFASVLLALAVGWLGRIFFRKD